MKRKFDLVAKTGKYKDRDGIEKNRFLNCGVILERDDGTIVVKIEQLPVNFSGWLACFEPRRQEQKPQEQKPVVYGQAHKPKDFDDEIPF